jgi:hypothetical protein
MNKAEERKSNPANTIAGRRSMSDHGRRAGGVFVSWGGLSEGARAAARAVGGKRVL